MNYKLLFDTAVLAGEILIKNGAETYRVEDTMYRILNMANFKTVQILVIMTGFIVTLDDPSMGGVLTASRRITTRGTNLEKVARVNELSRKFCKGELELEIVNEKMSQIWEEEEKVRGNYLAFMMINAGFAIMFGGRPKEIAIAAFIGVVIAVILRFCRKLNVHMFMENVLASVGISVLVGITEIISPIKLDSELLIISSIMPLVPGAAITNAVFDTLHGDYISGVARTAEAFVIAAAVAIGIALGLIMV